MSVSGSAKANKSTAQLLKNLLEAKEETLGTNTRNVNIFEKEREMGLEFEEQENKMQNLREKKKKKW